MGGGGYSLLQKMENPGRRGLLSEIPSVVGVWIFSGTTQLPLWKICIRGDRAAEETLIGCFVECQSIKKVGGRHSIEELYRALSFVSPFCPGCFTERNET